MVLYLIYVFVYIYIHTYNICIYRNDIHILSAQLVVRVAVFVLCGDDGMRSVRGGCERIGTVLIVIIIIDEIE